MAAGRIGLAQSRRMGAIVAGETRAAGLRMIERHDGGLPQTCRVAGHATIAGLEMRPRLASDGSRAG